MNHKPTEYNKGRKGILKQIADFKIKPIKIPEPGLGLTLKEEPDFESLEMLSWLNIITHPSIILILGARGSGKSAAGYKILEYLRHIADPYVVGLPRQARRLLPEWIGSVPTIEDLPPNSIGLIDESYTLFHSRSSSSERAKVLSNLINLSRQRGITLIFISQEARQIDINIASSANIIIIKNPSILQLEFERKELRKIAEEASRMFADINKRDRNKWAYVYAPNSDFVGMMENSLPSFWTPGLSKAYAENTPINEMVIPKKMSLEQKKEKARELHNNGWSYRQIAEYLSVSKSTVYNWIHGYPYRHRS